MVVVVGVNGSGKSSMLKLLPRIFDPTSGEIFIDDKPLSSFDVDKLRMSIAYLSQSQEMYPISLRDNLQLGISDAGNLAQTQLDEAARLGGSYDMIHKLRDGFDTILNPVPTCGTSCVGVGYGEVSRAVMTEWEKHKKDGTSVSGEHDHPY